MALFEDYEIFWWCANPPQGEWLSTPAYACGLPNTRTFPALLLNIFALTERNSRLCVVTNVVTRGFRGEPGCHDPPPRPPFLKACTCYPRTRCQTTWQCYFQVNFPVVGHKATVSRRTVFQRNMHHRKFPRIPRRGAAEHVTALPALPRPASAVLFGVACWKG